MLLIPNSLLLSYKDLKNEIIHIYIQMVKHGGLNQVGKVRSQTPKVEPMQRDKKKPKGRAAQRAKYNDRFKTLTKNTGKGKGPNAQELK